MIQHNTPLLARTISSSHDMTADCVDCKTLIDKHSEKQRLAYTINSVIRNSDVSDIIAQYSYKKYIFNPQFCEAPMCIDCQNQQHVPTTCSNCTFCWYVMLH